MDGSEETREEMEENHRSPSFIIQLFERLAFEGGQDVHDQVTSMVNFWSSVQITLEMLDVLIDCIKMIFLQAYLWKNVRINDFLIAFIHVIHLSYQTNKNLALVFETIIDLFGQMIVAIDSQIRHRTLHFLNQLQSRMDLSRSAFVPDQLETNLLELLNNETILNVLDEVVPLASRFQWKNPRFIDAFLRRLMSPKWHLYPDRCRQVISSLVYSPSAVKYLVTNLEKDTDLFQCSLECLLAEERGFTLDRLDHRARGVLWKIASTTRDSARLILSRWISEKGGQSLVQILQYSTVAEQVSKEDNDHMDRALEYFLADENIRRIVVNNTRLAIGTTKGGLLPKTIPNYVEHLYLWCLLCRLFPEDDPQWNVHPDFHEFLAYFYRLIKGSIDQTLTSDKIYLLCQYASILSTFDTIDIYRRKCIEAISRCLLVHFGQYEQLMKHAFQLLHLIHPSAENQDERYQLITYTLNELIQRCQNDRDEENTFEQCITIVRVFIEEEKAFDTNQTDLKELIHSLVRSGLAQGHRKTQLQTLETIHVLVIYCRDEAKDCIPYIYQILNQTEDPLFKPKCLAICFDILLIHGIDLVPLPPSSSSTGALTPAEVLESLVITLFSNRTYEIKTITATYLIRFLLSSRLLPSIPLLQALLHYRFSTDQRSVDQQQRDQITSFFYFFTHLSNAHVKLMERLTLELITHSLPYTSDPSTIAYRTVLSESMSSFCLELLSLPTLPAENDQERTHSHYYLAKHLLDDLHNSTSHRTTVILKSYLNILKHLQYSYMKQEELENLFELTHRLEEVCFNLPALVLNAMKSVKEQIHSCLQLINKFVHGNHENKRPHSQSSLSSSPIKRSALSSQSVLRDRTNQPLSSMSSKGIKRKISTTRYQTLDFVDDIDDMF